MLVGERPAWGCCSPRPPTARSRSSTPGAEARTACPVTRVAASLKTMTTTRRRLIRRGLVSVLLVLSPSSVAPPDSGGVVMPHPGLDHSGFPAQKSGLRPKHHSLTVVARKASLTARDSWPSRAQESGLRPKHHSLTVVARKGESSPRVPGATSECQRMGARNACVHPVRLSNT